MENAKILAELVDSKLAQHYSLDSGGKKKVRRLLNTECWQNQQRPESKASSNREENNPFWGS